MLFFTDISSKFSNYCLLNVNQYDSKLKNDKAIIFVDPSVMELRNSNEYKKCR